MIERPSSSPPLSLTSPQCDQIAVRSSSSRGLRQLFFAPMKASRPLASTRNRARWTFFWPAESRLVTVTLSLAVVMSAWMTDVSSWTSAPFFAAFFKRMWSNSPRITWNERYVSSLMTCSKHQVVDILPSRSIKRTPGLRTKLFFSWSTTPRSSKRQ